MLCLTRCTCTHTYYPYYLIPFLVSNVLDQFALVLEMKTLTEMVVRAQRKGRFVLGVQGGHVASATEM